jgi:hypothetical protein
LFVQGEDGIPENVARLIGRGTNRPLPRVPADQALSVTDIERMMEAQRVDGANSKEPGK